MVAVPLRCCLLQFHNDILAQENDWIYSKILLNSSTILPLLPKIKYEINPKFIVT